MGLFGFNKKNKEQTYAESTPTTSTVAPTPVETTGREVTLDLNKGGLLNLEKNDFLDLSKVSSTLEHARVSAGWDVNERWGDDYDLDLCMILLNDKGKLVKTVNNCVYYGEKRSSGIQLDKDNLTGEGEGDDENIFVNFKAIAPEVSRIIVCVVIYQAASRGQCFKNVKNAYVRLVDEAQHPEKEICRYKLTEEGGNNTAIKFAELTRNANGWNFKALGEYTKASIGDIRNQYR